MIDNRNLYEMGFDNVLILDDKLEEVQSIISLLNSCGISTTYYKKVIGQDDEGNKVVVNSNTKLIILDLYLSDPEEAIESAIDSVLYFSQNIKGPYLILVWSKNNYEEFRQELEEALKDILKSGEIYNLPVFIDKIDVVKSSASTKDIAEIMGEIENKILNNFFADNKNIENIFSISKINQEEQSAIWNFIIENTNENEDFNSIDENTKATNLVLSKVVMSLDAAHGVEGTGKGIASLQSKLIENRLNLTPLEYEKLSCFEDMSQTEINQEGFTEADSKEEKSLELDDSIKFNVQSLLFKHKIEKNILKGFEHPGVFIEFDESELKSIRPKMEYFNTDNYFKKDSGKMVTFDENEEEGDTVSLKVKVGKEFCTHTYKYKFGAIIITPFCDFAQCNRNNRLLLQALIISGKIPNYKTLVNSYLKKGYEILRLSYNEVLIYNLKDTFTVQNDMNFDNKKKLDYYLSKEIINNIQAKTGADLSRVGIINL